MSKVGTETVINSYGSATLALARGETKTWQKIFAKKHKRIVVPAEAIAEKEASLRDMTMPCIRLMLFR